MIDFRNRVPSPTRFLAVLCLGAAVASVSAQEVDVRIDPTEAQVGQPVQIEVTATGRSQARLLEELSVEGLEIVSQSDQFQMQMQFPGFGMQVTTTFSLVAIPTKEGEITIPPLRIRLDGKVFRTAAQTIAVGPNMGGVPTRPAIPVPPGGGAINPGIRVQPHVPPTAQPQQPSATQQARTHFGEIVVPQESAFVGEVVPTDLRFYIDARIPSEFSDRVSFSGEGFTVGRVVPTQVVRRDLGDVPYACRVFRTSITPAKAGTLEIPNASTDARVEVPVQNPFGNDDFFGGMMRNFGMTDVREIEILTNRASLEVKPLPKDGRPDDFAGAVGDFQIRVDASPKKTAPGEPVTLTVTLSGRGNFEALGAPTLVDAEGWRVYDPAEDFKPSPTDPIGLHGEKTFQFTLVAREAQKATPPVRFSYFDPGEEKYVTLEGPPVALDAEGSGRSAPQVADATAAASPTPATPPSTPVPGRDLSRDNRTTNFLPRAWSPGYWIAGGLLALLWVAGFVVLLLRKRRDDPATQRAAELRALRAGLKGLDAHGIPLDEFVSRACHFLESRLGGSDIESAAISDSDRLLLEELVHAHGAALYSTQKAADLLPEKRSAIVKALRNLDKAMPHPPAKPRGSTIQ